MKKLLCCLLASVVSATLTVIAAPAHALEQPAMSISSEHRLEERDFPPIAGNDPGPVLATVEDCKISPTCDTIPVNIDIPPKYLYRLTISLSWVSPMAGDTSATDMDMYFYDGHYRIQYEETGEMQKDAQGNPVYAWDYDEAGSAATSANPEVGKVAGIDRTSPTHIFYIVINNFAGPNSGYHIKIEFIPIILPPRRSPATRVRPSFTTNNTKTESAAKASPTPSPKLSPVKVPGADGPLVNLPLTIVKDASRGPTKSSSGGLVAGVIGLLILALGLGGFFFIRFRRSKVPE